MEQPTAHALQAFLSALGYQATVQANPTPDPTISNDSIVNVTPKTEKKLTTLTDIINFVNGEGLR